MAEAYLPEHIIHQIFLRMPIKPVVRLKRLSKQWNRLISDPFFMKSRSRRMIFLHGALSFHAIHNNGNHLMTKLRFSLRNLVSKEITVVGSFNGIVLLVNQYRYHHHHRMILYNPSSGETKMVLDPPVSDPSDEFVYGFGCGTALDDLKIVRIQTTGYISYCDVFNLKDWSWSKLSFSIGNHCIFNFPGTFANGFLYWYASVKGTDNQHIIVALDLKKMVFSNIGIPGGHQRLRLGTYNGQLCMISNKNGIDRSELWVMEEHEPGKLWTLVCSFKGVCVFSVLCILDDGRFLVGEQSLKRKLVHKQSLKNLVIYDMLKDSYKKVKALKSFVGAESLQACEYVESLISPANICSV